MKNKSILIKAATAAILIFAGLGFICPGIAEAKPKPQRAHWQSAAEEKAAFDEVIKGGNKAVLAVCETLTPPAEGGDIKARYVIGGLALYTSRPGAETERRMFSEAIMQAVQKAKDKDVKSFLLGLLRWCGGKESVAPLGVILADADLVEPAAMALCSIRAEGTTDVLLNALKNAKGKQVITLVKALGDLQSKQAVSAISTFATDEDRDLRRTALYALANIGQDGDSGSILKRACQAKDPLEKSIAGALYLQYANRLAESGKKDQGIAVCRDVIAISAEQGSENLLPEALNTLAAITGDDAVPELVKAANSSNTVASVAAMNTLIRMRSTKSGAEIEEILKNGPTQSRLALLNSLTSDDSQLLAKSIAPNLKHADPNIRTAAINALAGKNGLPFLLEILPSGSTSDLLTLKKAILISAGNKEMKEVAAAMVNASAPAKAVILEILGLRSATSQVETILVSVTDPDQKVRLAAIKALSFTARAEHLQKMIDILPKMTEQSEQAAMVRSITSTAKTIADQHQRTQLLLSALATAPQAVKISIIEILPELGGSKALDAVISAISGNDEAIKKAAVRALANWPDQEAAPAMLKTATGAKELTQQVLLLRGYVRLVRAGSMKPEIKVGMIKEAIPLARRPDEKKLLLGALVDIKTVESLAVTSSYFDDPDVREEAANSACLISCPEKGENKGLFDPAVKPVLIKAASIVKDNNIKKKLEAHSARIK